ncbi:MAG: hypothetical protein ABEH77_11525 [Halobacteriaceae archaeon]
MATESPPSSTETPVTDNLGAVVGSGALAGVGLLFLVAGVREFWLFLAAGGPDPVPTLAAVLAVTVFGATLVLAGTVQAVSVAGAAGE